MNVSNNGTCECTVERSVTNSLAYCPIDDRSLAFYVVKASDCTNSLCMYFMLPPLEKYVVATH